MGFRLETSAIRDEKPTADAERCIECWKRSRTAFYDRALRAFPPVGAMMKTRSSAGADVQ